MEFRQDIAECYANVILLRAQCLRPAAGFPEDNQYYIFSLFSLLEPSQPPTLMAFHNSSSSSLRVTWLHIPPQYAHGVLLGYRVLYRSLNVTEDMYSVAEVGPTTLEVELENLYEYMEYGVRLMGFTKKGLGTVSDEEIVRTDQDGKLNYYHHYRISSSPPLSSSVIIIVIVIFDFRYHYQLSSSSSITTVVISRHRRPSSLLSSLSSTSNTIIGHHQHKNVMETP